MVGAEHVYAKLEDLEPEVRTLVEGKRLVHPYSKDLPILLESFDNFGKGSFWLNIGTNVPVLSDVSIWKLISWLSSVNVNEFDLFLPFKVALEIPISFDEAEIKWADKAWVSDVIWVATAKVALDLLVKNSDEPITVVVRP